MKFTKLLQKSISEIPAGVYRTCWFSQVTYWDVLHSTLKSRYDKNQKQKPKQNFSWALPLLSILQHYFTFDTRRVGFSCIKQFSHTCNVTQFGHYLPGNSVRSHRLRAQSHKTVPQHHSQQTRFRLASCKLRLSSVLLAGLHNPLLRFD